jgi:pimeloyl-ACP methyl ester carboxylesterase
VCLVGLLIVTGLYLVCVVGLTLFQRRLLYHPCRVPGADLAATAAKAGFESWRDARGDLIGWMRLSESAPAKRQLLLCHGNAGCARDWFHYADGFQAVEPSDFYILEYPGFGGRPGSPTQTNLLLAADEAFKSLPTTCSVYLVGESLGTGVTAWLAGAHDRQIGGVFLVAPYISITAVAQRHLPLFPVRLMLKDKYPAGEWLGQYGGPVAVLLAERDQVVPNDLGRQLFEQYRGPKKLWMEPGAGHADVHRPGNDIWKQVISFWNENPR